MASFDSLQSLQTELIRKTLTGSVFIAEATADPIGTALTAVTAGPPEVHDLVALPTGYTDLGYTTDAGAVFNTETTTSDITSWQSTSPTRSDINAETTTVQVVTQETKLETLGLYTGSSFTGIEAAATTGDVIIKKPQRPSSRYYRLFVLSQDETEDGEIYIGRFLPRAKVTGRGGQSHDKSDNAFQYDVTFTGFRDTIYGTAESFLFGGPGWLALLTQMGISQAA